MQYKSLTGNTVVSAASTKLMGWSLNGSVTGVVTIYDGVDNTGAIVVKMNIANGTQDTRYFDGGLQMTKGIYVEYTSGNFVGSVWFE